MSTMTDAELTSMVLIIITIFFPITYIYVNLQINICMNLQAQLEAMQAQALIDYKIPESKVSTSNNVYPDAKTNRRRPSKSQKSLLQMNISQVQLIVIVKKCK